MKKLLHEYEKLIKLFASKDSLELSLNKVLNLVVFYPSTDPKCLKYYDKDIESAKS